MILAAVLLGAGCVSPGSPGERPPSPVDPDELLVHAFLDQYHGSGGNVDTELLVLEILGEEESLSWPGYPLLLSPALPEAGSAAAPPAVLEIRGTLVFLAGGTLEDYQGRHTAGRIVLIEPELENLGPALHQARLFGASAVVVSPQEGSSSRDPGPWIRGTFKHPGVPVFFIFSSHAAALREREGQEMTLRFPRSPRGESIAPGSSPAGFLWVPERRREEERRRITLRAVLAEQNRELRRPWPVTVLPPDLTPEEWVREILRQDRQILSPLPAYPQLRTAWTRRNREAGEAVFYDLVLSRTDELNRRLSRLNRQEREGLPASPETVPDYGRLETELTQIAHEISRFYVILELKLLNLALGEGVDLMVNGGEEELASLFSLYLTSAQAIPRFHPAAAWASEPGSFTASPGDGERWVPDLGDLFLAVSLGLSRDQDSRKGMIEELKYWEERSRGLLQRAEEGFLFRLEDLMARIDGVTELLPASP